MKKVIAIAAVACAVSSQGLAAPVWSEDFSYGQPNDLSTIGDASWNGATTSYIIGGTSNLVMRAFGEPWTFVNNVRSDTSVATLSLDLRSDAVFSGDSYLRLAMSGTTGNVGLVDFNGGTDNVQSVGTGAYDHFDVIVNNTASPVAIENLGGTVAANTLAVYKEGALITTAAATVDADGFGLWLNNGGTVGSPAEVMYGDNMEWRENAYAIPEPATLGLLGIFGGMMMFVRRFFRI